ncbi:uncharacterized protein LOC122850068 [Aphidius gifuensis]|uniref:uncharacterized protein LOC122850068 n=1 Tax=Aphidius gifuensis TaxID=684658 RepID=UPI001CDC2542|nr:uncharacterized protein LOC122850068 [Aphidius gifuensis]
MISSGFLLRGAILCEKYCLIPWLTLTSFCIVLHVGSSIIEFAVFFSVKCSTPDKFTSLIGLLFICVVEMYFIATIYFFYDKLDDDFLNQQNDNYLTHHSPVTNNHINITPGVYTLSSTITNELPPAYDQIPSNNPPLYADAIAQIIVNKSNQ